MRIIPRGKLGRAGYMTGKEARSFAQSGGSGPECAKSGCSALAGSHRFKQPGAENYCKNHAHPGNR